MDANSDQLEWGEQASIFFLLIAKQNLINDEIVSFGRQRDDSVSHTPHGPSGNRAAMYRYDIVPVDGRRREGETVRIV